MELNTSMKKYPHTDYNYQPDFYLIEYDIYLEHFGVDENNRAKWLNDANSNEVGPKEKEYVDSIKEKRGS